MNDEVSLPVVGGFRWAALAAGIKKSGAPDLALLVADAPCTAAAVLTTNLVRAAPVTITAERVRAGRARAVLVNAGCANACTGKPGLAAARRATDAVARALGTPPASVLPASTGVIGQLLPAEKIAEAAPALVAALSPEGAPAFARAIMTTDRWPKTSSATLRVGGREVTVVGIAKGAGMIHPDMATTLAFVATDAAVTPAFLRSALRAATAATFNTVSVDGDTSTNDTIIALASGASGAPLLRGREPAARAFGQALRSVLDALAQSIVRDGEGAEHAVTFDVRGLPTAAAARRIAATIATSPLVKTALHGEDPNCGRILAAAGRAGVRFDPDRAEIRVGDTVIVRRGLAVGPAAEALAHETMRGETYEIRVTLGAGKGRARYTTCDFGAEYVRINADYRS